jgi:hypothetical protein
MMMPTDQLSEKHSLPQALVSLLVRSRVRSTTRLQSLWLRKACLPFAYVAAFRYAEKVPLRAAAVLLGLHPTNRTKTVRARELPRFMISQARAGNGINTY